VLQAAPRVLPGKSEASASFQRNGRVTGDFQETQRKLKKILKINGLPRWRNW
jgi:hypothetical protein